MKKLLVLLMALFLVGCEEVSDLIKIQDANKEIQEIHMDLIIDTDFDVDMEETGLDFGIDLGMNVSLDMSNGITHSVTTVEFLGMALNVEQYSRNESGEYVVYTNLFGIWTKEVVEPGEAEQMKFDVAEFMKALNGSFELIDPITVEGKELKQMKMTMTVEQIQNILGFDFSNEEMTEEELQTQLQTEMSFVLGYTEETYLIERIEIDVTELIGEAPEAVEVSSITLLIELSNHNEVGEIVIPEEALNADSMWTTNE